jgi:hypothetical protein
MKRSAKTEKGRSKPSPRRGGPANFQGTGYQIDVATFEALRLIQSELWTPDSGAVLSMEARLVDFAGQTGFDLASHPHECHFEVKLSPSRQEVADWLRNLVEAHKRNPKVAFKLVHARGGAPVADLAEIGRMAREAASEPHFTELATTTLDAKQRALVESLEASAWEIARQIEVIPRPEQDLRERISWMAEGLSGAEGGVRLVEMLTNEIRLACTERRSFTIAALVDEAKRRGIYLHAPRETTGSSVAATSALIVLQDCEDPIPIDLLAGAVGTDPEILRSDLGEYILRGVVRLSGTLVSARPLSNTLTNERRTDLLCRTLRALVLLCRDRERRAVAVSQVRNIARLADICFEADPELVSSVFPAADKLLKATGDLHLVLDVARLSIRAAGRQPSPGQAPSNQMLRDKTQTLICGLSWVYQRTDRLSEARVHGEESLRRGEELGWSRNSAFCKKCIGRLLRLEAESCKDEDQRELLLRRSVTSLQEAIPIFEAGQDADLGPGCEDVGECLSLIGRSHLVSKDLKAAREAIIGAYEILEHFRPSKAWADLVILDGELQLREGRSQVAIDRSDEVLGNLPDGDSEISEIRARAFLLKASAFRSEKRLEWAADAYSRAAAEYAALGDSTKEGRAQWNELLVRQTIKPGVVPKDLAQLLADESDPSVCVQAVKIYKERVAGRSGGKARSQRHGATTAYLEQLVREARIEARRKQTSWD